MNTFFKHNFFYPFVFGLMIITFVSCNSGSKNLKITDSNLPVLVIDPYGRVIKQEPKINARMEVITPTDIKNSSYQKTKLNIRIEKRGLYSNTIPKKQYGFEIIDRELEDKNFPLCGLPSESDWILNGPYSDKSLMRNFLAYTLYRKMGYYSSRVKFVEVYIKTDTSGQMKNEYQGIYLLLEKIKRSKYRVDFRKMEVEDPDFNNLSFIIEMLPEGRLDMVDTAFCSAISQSYFTIINPKPDKLTPDQSKQIENYINHFDQALLRPNKDSIKSYNDFIDLTNLADYLLFNEFVKNTDVFFASNFLYKDLNGKLKFGPVWDYNITFGNVDYTSGKNPKRWYLSTLPHPWVKRLISDRGFIKIFKERWDVHKDHVFNSDTIDALIDQKYQLIDAARKRNFEKWDVIGKKLWPNPEPIPQSYDGEIDYLKNWIHQRIEFIDDNIDNL